MAVVPCPPNTPPAYGVVVFNFAEWSGLYPEFAGIAPASAQAAFDNATLVMSNSCRSLIRDANKRQTLLYLLTAHVCFLRFGKNDGAGVIVPPPQVVGRIANATEGSVTVGVQLEGTNEQRAWFSQTQYGLTYWQATAQYRTFQYIGPPAQCCGQCGAPLAGCVCGMGIGPTGTGWGGYNGGTA